MPPPDPPLLHVAHWNLHADHRALAESLVTRDGEEARTWHARRDRVIGVLVELFAHADVVVTTENSHFWWLLHELQRALPEVQGEFCASASPASDTRVRALYTAYGLLQVAHEEVGAGEAPPLCLDTCSEICLRAYDEAEGGGAGDALADDPMDVRDDTAVTLTSSLLPSYQYDVVNAWFHLEQDARLTKALTETLGWTSYAEEHVPTQHRPLDRNGNDLYVGPDGVGIYWNSAKVQYAATLAHDDAHYVGPLPCNRGGLCGLRFLVLGKDHIVDVFGAQLADGSRVDGAEEPYGAGLARVCRWMHAYDHLHVDQQVACVSHLGFQASEEEEEAATDRAGRVGGGATNAPDHHARLVDPPRLWPLDDATALVDVLPTDHPTTAVCRLRATDGQLTATTLDRVLVRTGRVGDAWAGWSGSGSGSEGDGDSSEGNSDSSSDEEATGDATASAPELDPSCLPRPTLVRPLTFRTLAPQAYQLARAWATSIPARYALRNAAVFEEWADVVGANYVPDALVAGLPGVDHAGAFDAVAEALYPSPACWSDHPPVWAGVPSRDVAAMRPSTVGAAAATYTARVGEKRSRRRRGCGCATGEWSTWVGACASVGVYVLHTRHWYTLTSAPMLALEGVAAACFVHTVGQLW
jgi:hypothetical protein